MPAFCVSARSQVGYIFKCLYYSQTSGSGTSTTRYLNFSNMSQRLIKRHRKHERYIGCLWTAESLVLTVEIHILRRILTTKRQCRGHAEETFTVELFGRHSLSLFRGHWTRIRFPASGPWLYFLTETLRRSSLALKFSFLEKIKTYRRCNPCNKIDTMAENELVGHLQKQLLLFLSTPGDIVPRGVCRVPLHKDSLKFILYFFFMGLSPRLVRNQQVRHGRSRFGVDLQIILPGGSAKHILFGWCPRAFLTSRMMVRNMTAQAHCRSKRCLDTAKQQNL